MKREEGFVLFSGAEKRTKRVRSFSRSLRENEPLEPLKSGGYNAGRPCRCHNHLILLVLRRTSNHSPDLSPIVGKRLNRSSCRSDIMVF